MANKISHWLTTPGKLTTELTEYNRQCVDYAALLDRLVEAVKDAICGLEIYAAANPMVKNKGLAAMHKNLLAALRDIELESEAPKYRPYTPAEAVQFLGRTMIYSKYPTGKYHLTGVGLTHALIAGDQGYSSYENICEYYTWADTGEPCGMKEEA